MMRTKLTDLCDIQYGYAFDSKKFTEDSNCIPLIRIRDVKRGFSETYYSGEYPKEYIIRKNDLLVGMDGEFNIARWQSQDALLNQRVCRVIAKQGVCEDYLRFALTVELKIIENRTAFVTVKHLSAKELNKIELDIPEYGVQERIAKTLIIIEQVLCSRKQQLQQLDELVKARFVELFGDTILNPYGWNKDVLGTVCDVRDGTHDSPKYYEVGYPLVTSKNVTSGKIDLSNCSLISETDYIKINERSKVDIGDVLMPMIGTVGNPVIVDIEPCFAIKNVALIKFKSNSKVLNVYIQELLKSDYFDDVVLSKVRGGTQKFISLGDIRKLEILVPPIELQNEFADFVKQIDKSKFVVQKALDEAQTLFDSLMQEYFG